MSSRQGRWMLLAFAANLLVICTIFILFMNLDYPKVGHDYTQVIAYLLDIVLHVRNNGFSIQWYTPSFGAGLPAFPSPNNTQFSVPAALALMMEPWPAVLISAAIFISAGFYSGFQLYYQVLKLDWKTSLLGSLFFSANGFMMERLAVGHTGFQIFAVLPVLIIACLDETLPVAIGAILIALVTALAIHGAGYIILVIFGLSLLLIFPILYIFRPGLFHWKRFFAVLSLGGLTGLLISASKLAAVYSYMRFFPRLIADNPVASIWRGLLGILLQLLGTMNLLPLFWLAHLKPILLQNMLESISGTGYANFVFGYWEFDMSLTPLVFGIILVALVSCLRSPAKYLQKLKSEYKWLAVLLLAFCTALCLELTMAQGMLYELFGKLPVLGSLHVNLRYAAAFMFPLCLLAALVLNKWWPGLPKKKSAVIFMIINILTLLPLGTYFLLGDDAQNRNYDIRPSSSIFASIRAGDSFEVRQNGITPDYTQALLTNTSNLNPYEPLFGYFLETFHPEAKPGSVWDISGGYYNLSDPSGYVFPEVNGSRTFARIPVTDKDKLDAFVKHLVPDWKIPISQQILDWVSLISSLAAGLYFLGFMIQQLLNSLKGRASQHNANG